VRKVKESKVPRLTVEKVQELLRKGAKSAEELRETLERDHLGGYSRSMALRLD
jgi:hypothetical protein